MRRIKSLVIITALFVSLLVAGCNTSTAHQDISALNATSEGLPHASTLIDAGEGGSLTAHAQQGQHYTTFGIDGMEVFTPQPGGSAFIGQAGAALFDPKDASIDTLEMQFDVYEGPNGPMVYAKSVALTGLNAIISDPIKAQAHQWQAWVESLVTLAETDRAKYEAQMQALREIAPAVADALQNAVLAAMTGGG